MDDFNRIVKALETTRDPMFASVKALVIRLNELRQQIDAIQELKEVKTELQEIKIELQSNNKALQSMIAGLMELLSKLQLEVKN